MPAIRIVIHGPNGHDVDFQERESDPEVIEDVSFGGERAITTAGETPEEQVERMLYDAYLRARKAYGLD